MKIDTTFFILILVIMLVLECQVSVNKRDIKVLKSLSNSTGQTFNDNITSLYEHIDYANDRINHLAEAIHYRWVYQQDEVKEAHYEKCSNDCGSSQALDMFGHFIHHNF